MSLASGAFASVSAVEHGAVGGIGICLIVACVMVHYEVLNQISGLMPRLKKLHRVRILVLILGLLVTHAIEILIYGAAYTMLNAKEAYGQIVEFGSNASTSWLDHMYFSFITYTTVGYGDLVPIGGIRFIAVTQGLCGWLLLGWSASFTVVEMQRFWKDSPNK